MKIEIDVPDALWEEIQRHPGEDWPAVAGRAFAVRLEEIRRKSASYGFGYAWARDRADPGDLRAMVRAPSHASAAAIVRGSSGFSQRDEFGDALRPTDEMWEAFVDGATARYNDLAG